MMALHLARIVAIILVVLACSFLPFLPGGYDGLALTLSAMAQMSGVAGLLLVPIGALWLIYELGQRASKPVAAYYFAIAAMVAGGLVAMAVALGASIHLDLSFGFITLALWGYVVSRLAPSLKRLKTTVRQSFHPAPLYLVCIPVVVALVQWTLVPRAVAFSRNYAIRQSVTLLNDIEAYQKANGRYPASLAALWPDYKPGVIGIEQYHYEPYGDAYNLYFEQAAVQFGTREIVMYNKLDEHHLPSHAMDILLWTPEQLRSRKAYYALNNADIPHWKYFWFD
jgi:hypothetical protein